MLELPTLYKKTSKDKITQWTVSVKDRTITTVFGQTDGKLQTYHETIDSGKNAGKSNATTPEQQATFEAQSAWNFKVNREGYVDHIDNIHAKRETPVPMLAHSYEKQSEKIVFPAFYQYKFDGHRCLAVTVDGVCTLYSRTGKIITGVPHINRYLELYFDNVTLDGELYNHAYKDRFEELSSFIRQETPIDGHEVVEYHVYDVLSLPASTSYKERLISLTAFFMIQSASMDLNMSTANPIKLAFTDSIEENQVIEKFKESLALGYEGIMLRNVDGLYVNKRSYDLQKVKEMADAEFKVTAVSEGRGKLKGHAMLECLADNGETFKVKLKGEFAYLKHIFENPDDFVGKQLTVQYQGVTAYGMPRFPVGLRFREDV